MKSNLLRRMPLAILGCLMLTAADPSNATEWPVERQNNRRTALAPGEGIIDIPAVRGRAYLGGSLSSVSMLADDVNNDGATEIVLAAGGKVIVKDIEDRVLWDTGLLSANGILGAYDFNGDKSSEILVYGSDGLYILGGRNGEELWHVTDFAPGGNTSNVLNTRVVDLNGDQLPDILFKPFWFSDGMVHAYSFEAGFSKDDPSSNQLWEHDITGGHDGGYYPVIGDANMDGIPEVLSSNWAELEVLNGVSGELFRLYTLAQSIYRGRTQLINVDGDPQPELVHLTDYSSFHSIEIFDMLTNTISPVVQLKFGESDSLNAPTESVMDLDGDGLFEILVNRFNGEQWNGMVYRYETDDENPTMGTLTLVDQLDGQIIYGALDSNGDGLMEVLAQTVPPGRSTSGFGTIRVYTVSDAGLRYSWSMENASWQTLSSRGSAVLNPIGTKGDLAARDVDGDGDMELYVLLDEDQNQRADALVLLDAGGSEELARFTMGENNPASVVWLGEHLTSATSENDVLVANSFGVLVSLNHSLEAVQTFKVGGYLKSPLIADLEGDGFQDLVINTSSGVVKSLDPTGLEQSGQTESLNWSYDPATSQFGLAVDIDLDGELEVVVRNGRDASDPRLELLDSQGQAIHSLSFDVLPYNLIAGNFVGTEHRDIFGIHQGLNSLYYLFVIDGETWTLAWETVAVNDSPPPSQRTSAVVDLDGDGLDDIAYSQGQYFCHVKGSNGDNLGCEDYALYDGSIMVGNVDDTAVADGATDYDPDFLLVVYDRLTQVNLDFSQDWAVYGPSESEKWGSTTEPGAVLLDADGDGLSEVFMAAADTLYRIDGDGVVAWSLPLEDGAVGVGGSNMTLGKLAAGDVDGDGDYELVVGGSDGWLYAVNARTGELKWSHNFYYQMGSPVVGDIDNDGLLDIAVPASDGYVYLVTQAVLPEPAEVRDVSVNVDGELENPDVDVDVTEVVSRLGVAWTEVEGADGYLYAIISDNGTYVIDWTDVGQTTQVSISESRLVYGHTYHVLVQAYLTERDGSPWAESDGVQIIDLTGPSVSDVVASPNPFCPEISGTEMGAMLEDLTGVTSYMVEIYGESGVVYSETRGVSGTSTQVSLPWDGRSSEGVRVDDGVYTVRFTVTDYGNHQSSGEGSVEVVSVLSSPTPEVSPTPEESPTPVESPTPGVSPSPTSGVTPTASVTPTPDDDTPPPDVTPTDVGTASPTEETTPPDVGPSEDTTDTPSDEGGDSVETSSGIDNGSCDCSIPAIGSRGSSRMPMGYGAPALFAFVSMLFRRRRR